MTLPHKLVLKWHVGKTAGKAELDRLERHFCFKLPEWYRRFMIEHGSGEAEAAETCVIFRDVGSLLADNSGEGMGLDMIDYGLFVFGGDGGGDAFAFNIRSSNREIVKLPFVSNYRTDGQVIGEELIDLFGYSPERDYPSFEPGI